MIPVYIGLGSNLCEPIRQLRDAIVALDQLSASRLVQVSSAYRSAAVGPGEQPDYLNAVALLDTALEPQALLEALQGIEQAQGRERKVRWGARSLDLDILLYGDSIVSTGSLTIPHPEMRRRNFVLYPLAEISGLNLILPDGTELATLLSQCPRGNLANTGLRLTHRDAHAPPGRGLTRR
ncbi:MAG: 2-amino-4-hydroxy-6-hydroxymethyldihydropteridine diphosphokinase [Halioglobus sp.]|nr:2-amino-4-hydroxy-6-hydroxymethyldihydropteridine diphosphokinase [Halioglobus sp.]